MADTKSTSTTPNALTALGLRTLSQGASIYDPVDASARLPSDTDPTLIIICGWAFAQPKHLAKYVKPHQDRFPKASILLVQNAIANALWVPDRWQMSYFQPAAAAVQEHIRCVEEPRVLVHTFSNGGSHTAVQLSQACRETCGGMRMPVGAIVFDSCPGQPRFGPTIAALTQGIPSKNPIVRATITGLTYGLIAGTGLCDVLNISELAAWKLYRKLNDLEDVFLLKSSRSEVAELIPRTYICSRTDDMIVMEDVEGHARVAREKLVSRGFSMSEIAEAIQFEEFVGSAHVNHIKNEGERYWKVVEKTWKRSISDLKLGGTRDFSATRN